MEELLKYTVEPVEHKCTVCEKVLDIDASTEYCSEQCWMEDFDLSPEDLQ
jgi:predicted nucleic acid-binding Zn ribbon protein